MTTQSPPTANEAAGATPIVDAHLAKWRDKTSYSPAIEGAKLIGLARTLERKLSAARQRIEGLETQMGAERVACNQRVEEQRLRVHAALDTVMGLKLEMGLYAERQNTLLTRATTAESRLAAVEAERDAIRLATIDECAKEIPDTWLDPLLTGPNSIIGNAPHNETAVAKLMTALTVRIRHLKEKS